MCTACVFMLWPFHMPKCTATAQLFQLRGNFLHTPEREVECSDFDQNPLQQRALCEYSTGYQLSADVSHTYVRGFTRRAVTNTAKACRRASTCSGNEQPHYLVLHVVVSFLSRILDLF